MRTSMPVWLLSACLIAPGAMAQQLNQPTVEPFKPLSSADSGQQDAAPAASRPAKVRSSAAERGKTPAVRSATASAAPAKPAANAGGATPPAAAAPVRVIDARGRPVTGAVQVRPNRIYDPSTGKYHDTVTVGDQQRIVD